MYNKFGFNCTRGQLNCESSSSATTIHTYISNDDLSVIEANGYFPDNFLFTPGNVLPNDYIFVTGGDARVTLIVNTIAPVTVSEFEQSFTTLTLTNVPVNNSDDELLVLNSFTGLVEKRSVDSLEKTGVINVVVSGPFANVNATITYSKVNHQVILRFNQDIETVATATAFIQFAPANVLAPLGLAPPVSISVPLLCVNNGGVMGELNIDSNGTLSADLLGATFPSGNTVGYTTQAVSYNTN